MSIFLSKSSLFNIQDKNISKFIEKYDDKLLITPSICDIIKFSSENNFTSFTINSFIKVISEDNEIKSKYFQYVRESMEFSFFAEYKCLDRLNLSLQAVYSISLIISL